MAKKYFFKDLWTITKKSAIAWKEADPFRQSAVVAYYAVFSMPALLVIIIASAGFVFGEEVVRGEISRQISSVMGKETSRQIEGIIARAGEHKSSMWAAAISIITLVLGCTGVFEELQVSLNQIWEVKAAAKKKWLKSMKDRLFSFGLVLSIGFLLLVSLLLTAVLTAFSRWIENHLPEFVLVLFHIIDLVLSLGVVMILFALMFKILPDVKVRWKNVWAGALVTALLFTIGKYALGIYFGKSNPGSTYGAAGSIILVMLWVSYSCMIVFFGAEFTKQYTLHSEGKIEPRKGAERIEANEEEKLVSEKKEAVETVDM
jgi:membrane protein